MAPLEKILCFYAFFEWNVLGQEPGGIVNGKVERVRLTFRFSTNYYTG